MKPRILVVDDMSHEWEAAQKKLGQDFDLVRACNGEEALALLDSGFDLIILDYTMGPGNGLWVCEKLVERGDTTPVLVNTNNSDGQRKMLGVLREAGIPCTTTRLCGFFAEPMQDIQALLLT